MATQTFACPACGSRKKLDNPHPGEKLHCTCGMSFPASPVFAIAAKAPGTRLTGTGWAVAAAAVLLVGTAGAAAWLMSRPQARTPDRPVGPGTTGSTQTAELPIIPIDHLTADPPTTGGHAAIEPDVPVPANPSPPQPKPVPPSTANPAETVSAVTLWDAYDLDPAAANARYTGKLLEVTGRGKLAKDSLGKTFFGAVVVQPRGKPTARMSPEEKQWERDGYPPSVRFYVSPEQAERLEKLPADRGVVVRGTCSGRKDRQDVYRGYIVELENCTVVEPGKK